MFGGGYNRGMNYGYSRGPRPNYGGRGRFVHNIYRIFLNPSRFTKLTPVVAREGFPAKPLQGQGFLHV